MEKINYLYMCVYIYGVKSFMTLKDFAKLSTNCNVGKSPR